MGVGSLPSPCGSWGWFLGYQAWWQLLIKVQGNANLADPEENPDF